jgi:hypothetical protein
VELEAVTVGGRVIQVGAEASPITKGVSLEKAPFVYFNDLPVLLTDGMISVSLPFHDLSQDPLGIAHQQHH